MTATLARNKSRVRFMLGERSTGQLDRAIEASVRAAVGDPVAEIALEWGEDGERDPALIVVRQAAGTWHAPLPDEIAGLYGEFIASYDLSWTEGEPPPEGDDA